MQKLAGPCRGATINEALRLLCFVLMVIASATTSSSLAFAQVEPNDLITPPKADKVKDLVLPGVFQRVKSSLAMKDRRDPGHRMAAAVQGRHEARLVPAGQRPP